MLDDQDTFIDAACLAEVMQQSSGSSQELDYFRDTKTTQEHSLLPRKRPRDNLDDIESCIDESVVSEPCTQRKHRSEDEL